MMRRFFHIKNRTDEIGRALNWIGDVSVELGCSHEECFTLELLLEEILSNIINHAYNDKNEHPIQIVFFIESDKAIIQIEDTGKHFNPLNAPHAPPVTNTAKVKIGGLGMLLINELTDGMKYERKDEKNILTVWIDISLETTNSRGV